MPITLALLAHGGIGYNRYVKRAALAVGCIALASCSSSVKGVTIDGAVVVTTDAPAQRVDAATNAIDANAVVDDAPVIAGNANLPEQVPLQGNVVHVAACTQAAIVTAIAAANAGDTVYFPACTYEITTTFSLKASVLYFGESGAILHNGAGTTIFRASAPNVDGITLEGLTFDGGNVVFSGDTTNFSSNVTMVYCTVENVLLSTQFGQMQGVLIDHLDNSRFDYNTFTNNGGGTEAYAMIVYTSNNSSFSHNTVVNTYQGFHFESADTTGGNGLTISYNTVSQLLAIGIELNKNNSNATIVGNHLDSWRSGDANGMALSIVPTGSNNTVENNYASGAGCATCNIGLEASGSNSFFEDNTIDGFYTNIAISCAPGSVFSGNILSNAGMWGTFDRDGGYCTGYTIGTNEINGVSTTGYNL